MLELIDEGLEAMLRASVPLGADQVDVSFEAPERQWSAKLTRPTVNMFLWDIRRSADRSKGGVETIERDGKTIRRIALPVVELRYLVTAWTSVHADERALLGGLMRSILANPVIPRAFLPAGLADVAEPHVMMTRSGEVQVDVFRALEGQLKPGINVVVVAEIDIGAERLAGPRTDSLGVSMTDRNSGAVDEPPRRIAGDVRDPTDAIGALVTSPIGSSTVNPAGRFLIRARPGDEITLHTDPPRTAVVPDSGGVVID